MVKNAALKYFERFFTYAVWTDHGAKEPLKRWMFLASAVPLRNPWLKHLSDVIYNLQT